MKRDFDNPFADYGGIVRGERFIGRRENIKALENRIIRPREPGNLAIIGEPRIGKSSLVYKTIMESKSELLKNRLIPIWINLATFDRAPIFFRSLVTTCYDAMGDMGLIADPLALAYQRAMQDELSWSEGYSRIQRFFEKVKIGGSNILFVLDEFDNARYLFKGDISAFQGLRELAYRPEWRVTFITTSRRSIRDIELQTQAISTFDGIFLKLYLGMFNDEDIEEYFNRLSSVASEITKDMREKIKFYCGGHPFLLEMLGYEFVELMRENGSANLDRAINNTERALIDEYDRIIELLREDGNLPKLLQILFGPVVDVKQTDVEELLRYGLLKPAPQDRYSAFSQHFHEYLRVIERQVDLWPLWRDTERSLRDIVTTKMIEQYGDDWVNKLEKAKSHLKKIFDACREARDREEKSFGSRASRNLIDFTYPQDIFAIIFAEWNIFKAILGKDKNYWDQRAQMLSKIRNPLAHNRDESLYEYERKITEGYCREILSILSVT